MRTLYFLLLAILVTAKIAVAQAPVDVVVEKNVPATMRDGVRLRADIYRPKGDGKYPVILARTPYGKDGAEKIERALAADGYIAVVQDCRGRFESEGWWYAFKSEEADGFDTVEWAARLPGSDGRVVMWGPSYVAITQVMTAVAAPPHLAGIAPWMVPADFHEGAVYQGGAFAELLADSWTRVVNVDPSTHKPPADLHAVDFYRDWLLHPSDDEYWKSMSIASRAEKIVVPGLYLSGWYDMFVPGTLRDYESVSQRGGVAARGKQRLIIGPWTHGETAPKSAEVDFGAAAELDPFLILHWYDFLLKGAANEFSDEKKPVKIFVMGKNVWREEESWPLKRAHATRYYLHSAGNANSLAGDGSLSPATPRGEKADQFTYDPKNPVPTQGGALCCAPDQPPGIADQRAVEQRPDVLVYTTEAFRTDVEVTGEIQLELYARSSAVDTDVTVKLVDVHPDGFAQNLTDGILRMRYRDSAEVPELMTPGKIYKVTVDAGATSNCFLAGHRLRIEISSSNSRRFDRNPNTGLSWDVEKNPIKATNAILHDGEHPSAIILPVISEK